MQGKTVTKVEQGVEPDHLQRSGGGLPPVEEFQEAFRRLEIEQLFQDAEEMGLHRLAGHVLAEANLDFVTEEPFDQMGEEPAGDEPF